MIIKFIDVNKRLSDEKRGKLLDPESDFYQYLDQLDKKFKKLYEKYIGSKIMDYNVELIFRNDPLTESLLLKRAKELEGKEVQNLDIIRIGRALVIETPHVDGYRTYATISFFPGGFPEPSNRMIEKIKSM
jgi:hypothetical protein